MDRGAWRATVHRVARVRHELVTKPPPPPPSRKMKSQERGIEEESLASPEKWHKKGKKST